MSMETEKYTITFLTYLGVISIRVWDKVAKKNVGKIELEHLKEYLTKKANKKSGMKLVEKGKGNTLSVYELK